LKNETATIDGNEAGARVAYKINEIISWACSGCGETPYIKTIYFIISNICL